MEEDWGEGGEIRKLLDDVRKTVHNESVRVTLQYLQDNKMLRPQFRKLHPDLRKRLDIVEEMYWEGWYDREISERVHVVERTVRRDRNRLGLISRELDKSSS